MTIPELIYHVEVVSNVSFGEIASASKKRNVVEARFLYYYFLNAKYKMSSGKMAETTGQHFSTALKALVDVQKRLSSKDPFYDGFRTRFYLLESLILTQ